MTELESWAPVADETAQATVEDMAKNKIMPLRDHLNNPSFVYLFSKTIEAQS